MVACNGNGFLRCEDANKKCMLKPDPMWQLCIVQKGETKCPGDDRGYWPERHVYYDANDPIDEQRSCTDCACGAPKGSICKAHLYSYADNACSAPVDPGYTIASTGPKCIDIQPPGQPLGSKSATPPAYIPGTCDAIQSIPMGAAKAINP